MSRIAVHSLGPAELLRGAQIPVPAGRSHAALSRGMVSGSPGTMAIPAPAPAATPQDNVGLAQGNHDSRSSDSPNIWYPGVYYEVYGPDGNEHSPVSVFSDNQMPMPALNPLGPPAAGAGAFQPASQVSTNQWVAMGRPRLGGQYQVRQRKAVPKYQSLGSG